MFGKIPLSLVLLAIGGILTLVGFVAYFQDNATLNLAGFFYGVPILLGGLALQAAHLNPVPFSQPTSPEVLKLREEQATPTQNQVRKDVTRYRYGQEAHLDDSLQRLGLRPSGEEPPELKAIHEESVDGRYALILEFESASLPFSLWQERQDKIERFFGPNIRAEVHQAGEDRVNVALITRLEATPASEAA